MKGPHRSKKKALPLIKHFLINHWTENLSEGTLVKEHNLPCPQSWRGNVGSCFPCRVDSAQSPTDCSIHLCFCLVTAPYLPHVFPCLLPTLDCLVWNYNSAFAVTLILLLAHFPCLFLHQADGCGWATLGTLKGSWSLLHFINPSIVPLRSVFDKLL